MRRCTRHGMTQAARWSGRRQKGLPGLEGEASDGNCEVAIPEYDPARTGQGGARREASRQGTTRPLRLPLIHLGKRSSGSLRHEFGRRGCNDLFLAVWMHRDTKLFEDPECLLVDAVRLARCGRSNDRLHFDCGRDF